MMLQTSPVKQLCIRPSRRVKQEGCLQEQNGCDKLPDVLDHTRRVIDNVLDNRAYVRAKYVENQRRK